MHKLKTLWRSVWSAPVWDELETWTQVLLALGAVVLLFATLKTQAAHAGLPLEAAAAEPATATAGAYRTPWHEAYVHAAPAPRRVPAPSRLGSSS
jgi:hypothetical protein